MKGSAKQKRTRKVALSGDHRCVEVRDAAYGATLVVVDEYGFRDYVRLSGRALRDLKAALEAVSS